MLLRFPGIQLPLTLRSSQMNIPVCKIHYAGSLQSGFGNCSYLLMDLVPGIDGRHWFELDKKQEEALAPLARQKLHDEQDKVLFWMARIQLLLAQSQSHHSGPISIKDPQCMSVRNYYLSHLNRIKAHTIGPWYKGTKSDRLSTLKVVQVLEEILPALCEDNKFYATYMDLGGHNTIFDQDANLQALVDLDCVWFMPIGIAVQLPARVGLFSVLENENDWTEDEQWARVQRYAEIIKEMGKYIGIPEFAEYFAREMLGNGSIAALGFQVLDSKSANLCEEWLKAPPITALRKQWSNDMDSSILVPDMSKLEIKECSRKHETEECPGQHETKVTIDSYEREKPGPGLQRCHSMPDIIPSRTNRLKLLLHVDSCDSEA